MIYVADPVELGDNGFFYKNHFCEPHFLGEFFGKPEMVRLPQTLYFILEMIHFLQRTIFRSTQSQLQGQFKFPLFQLKIRQSWFMQFLLKKSVYAKSLIVYCTFCLTPFLALIAYYMLICHCSLASQGRVFPYTGRGYTIFASS